MAGALLVLSACALEAQPNFTITCPVPPEAANTMAYLLDWDTEMKVDSAIVTDTVVTFTGHADDPYIGRIVIGGQRGPVVFVEPGHITVSAAGIVSGTHYNDMNRACLDSMTSLSRQYSTLNLNDSVDAVRARVLVEEYEALPSKMWGENTRNILGLYWYMQQAFEFPLDRLEADVKTYPVLSRSAQARALLDVKRVKAATSTGHRYRDFTVSHPDGTVDSLSSFVHPGVYTAVCYWASWSEPSLSQLPLLRQLYDRYHHRGLNVVGVAVWDNPDDTRRAIEQHQLPWPCIIDAQTIPTDLYGIEAIPCIMLIDPDGRIAGRDLMGATLMQVVTDALEQFNVPEPVVSAPQPSENDSIAAF